MRPRDASEARQAWDDPTAISPRTEVVIAGLILFAGLVLRLYQITAPPVDFNSWRDTQTLMVARNFYREGMNLFSPSVDWRATTEFAAKGTVGGTELQVVPYLTAALYFVFGIQYWVGRIVPVAFAVLGAAFFYRLVRRFYGPACALFATLLLTVSPYYLYCGRLQMPEPFVYAMSFAALYYVDVWLSSEERGAWRIVPAACFTALTLLGKPQLAIVAVPIAFLIVHRFGLRAFVTPRVYAFAALVAAPVAAYIVYSYLLIVSAPGLFYAQSSLLDYGQYLTDPGYYIKVGQAVFRTALTPLVTILAVLGLFQRPRNAKSCFVYAWTAGALSFFILMPGGNITNGYYHLVLVPPAVILAARNLESIMRWRRFRWLAVVLAIIASGLCLHVARDFYRPYYAAAQHCGEWIAKNTPKDTRVLTASRNPATLYFADRVGWTAWRETFNMDLINKVVPLGAGVVAVSEEWFDNAYYPQYQGVRDELYDRFLCRHGEDFAVFFIQEPAELSLPADGRVVFGSPESRKYLRGTWGPDQTGHSGATFAAMGPSKRAFIVFAAQQPPARILLDIASATPNQEVAFSLNGQPAGQLALPNAFERGAAALDGLQNAPAQNGRWLLSIETSSQNENAASLLLYSIVATDK